MITYCYICDKDVQTNQKCKYYIVNKLIYIISIGFVDRPYQVLHKCEICKNKLFETLINQSKQKKFRKCESYLDFL